MSDYIKREDALNAIEVCVNESVMPEEWRSGMLDAYDEVKSYVPSADVVKARRGRWIKHGKGLWAADRNGNIITYKPDYECLNCGARTFEMPYNYCPTCGAKMLNGLDTGAWEDIEDDDE